MSTYYTPKRTKNLYDPASAKPFRLSRSRIELYMQCPRCFYLDRRLGVDRPPGFPFTLNSAVDKLLKKEFDLLRESATVHPLMKKYGVDAIPAKHELLDAWRDNFKGVQYAYPGTNLVIFGAIDELWQNSRGEYIIVDFKATAKNEEIIALDQDWQDGYKRQMEIYQWLVRRNGYKVSDTGYFVYCNGKLDMARFDGRLEFDITLIPYEGKDGWIDGVVKDVYACLRADAVPEAAPGCDYCRYREAVAGVEG